MVMLGLAVFVIVRPGRNGMVQIGSVWRGNAVQCGAMQAGLGSVMRCSVRHGMAGMVWYVVAMKGAIRQAWQGYVRRVNVLRTMLGCNLRPSGFVRRAFSIYCANRRRCKIPGNQAGQQERNKTMSKKMRRAYTALRMKDALGCYASVAIKIAVLAFAFSLAVVQTDMFAKAVAVSAAIAVISGILAVAAFLCGRRLISLGFTEVELERGNLA